MAQFEKVGVNNLSKLVYHAARRDAIVVVPTCHPDKDEFGHGSGHNMHWVKAQA
jgi:hypothetical protein